MLLLIGSASLRKKLCFGNGVCFAPYSLVTSSALARCCHMAGVVVIKVSIANISGP